MPKGPQGQKRPADVIESAIHIAKIATGEIEEKIDESKTLSRQGGLIGGKARAESLSAKKRKAIASKAAQVRWSKPRKP